MNNFMLTDQQKLKEYDCSPTKKYTNWLIKQYLDKKYDVEYIRNYIIEYHTLSIRGLINADIYSFKSIDEFKKEIDRVNNISSASRKELESDYDIIVDNKDFLLVRPNCHEASRKLGLSKFKNRTNEETGQQDCVWCTTYANSSHWDNYYFDNNITFYYFKFKEHNIPNEDYRMLACAVYKDDGMIETYDINDDLIDNTFLELFNLNKYLIPHNILERKKRNQKRFLNMLMQEKIVGDIILYPDSLKDFNIDINCKEIDGNLKLVGGFTEIPKFIKNIKVNGTFDCSYNDLKNLENSPKIVLGHFKCYNNNLVSLKGASSFVGKNFLCSDNKLKNLIGAPKYVMGTFDCCLNKIKSLVGVPEYVGESFDASRNDIENIDFFPLYVGFNIRLSDNKIKSLSALPNVINGTLSLNNNQITSLYGCPIRINGNLNCLKNKLKNRNGMPSHISGYFKGGFDFPNDLYNNLIPTSKYANLH